MQMKHNLFFLEGITHFYLVKKGEEANLSCETCQWEPDVDSDNVVDCSFSKTGPYKRASCLPGKQDLCKEIKDSTSNGCQISVKRGVFACVSELKNASCFILPFKPSAHHVKSFIVAQEEPDSKYERF